MTEHIKELNDFGFEVLFFKDDFGYHCEILKNDLYVLSVFSLTTEQLEAAMNDLLTEVKKLQP